MTSETSLNPETLHTPNWDADTLGSASSNAVRQYLRAAQDYGIPAESVLDALSLPKGILDNRTPRIEGRQFQTLIRYLIERTQDPLFGLKSAQYVQPGSYSVLGYMAMNCRTPREVIEKIPQYEVIVGDMGITRLERYPLNSSKSSESHLAMRWFCQYDDPEVKLHMVDNVLGSWLMFARWLTDSQQHPHAVFMQHAEPDKALLDHYQALFQAPLHFNAEMDALIIPSTGLDQPLRQPDPMLLSTLEQQASVLMAEIRQPHPIVLQVRTLLRELITQGPPRKESVAAELGMTERTLQRRLQQADSGYQLLLDQVRSETASKWLIESGMSAADIAERLGFSDARSFHRRFKIWTQLTPGEYRQQHRHQ